MLLAFLILKLYNVFNVYLIKVLYYLIEVDYAYTCC